MKKTIAFITSLCICSSAMLLIAAGATTKTKPAELKATVDDSLVGVKSSDSDDVTYTLGDDGTLTISGTGVIDELPVDKTKVKAVIIKDGITRIGFYAFYEYTALESITIPDSVKDIDRGAFCECTSLKSISVNSSHPVYSDLNGVLFDKNRTQLLCYPAGKKDLSYVIPDSVMGIGYYAFKNCSVLTSITVPDSIEYLADEAFYGCSGLKSIRIPDSVTGIGDNVFCGCTSFESLTIPASVKRMGDFPFRECTSLVSINVDKNNPIYSDINGIVFNKDKTEIVCYPAGKKELSYVIPDTVTSIGDFAFLECKNLESVTIPDSVTEIGDSAFCICTSLTSITILNPYCKIYDEPDTISNDCTPASSFYTGVIRGYEGSTAESYANRYNYKFEKCTVPVMTTSTTTTTSTTITTTGTVDTTPSSKLAVTVWGDIDCSGGINIADVVVLNRYLNDPTYQITDQGKVNADIYEPQDKTGKSVDHEKVKLTAADSEAILYELLEFTTIPQD